MYDDAQDALAAEYVLGTLSADEREHAEALMTLDPAFAVSVRTWERRLGELNVMVEAVEPPPEVWDKIKADLGEVAQIAAAPSVASPAVAAADDTDVGAPTPSLPAETAPATPAEPPPLLLDDDLLSDSIPLPPAPPTEGELPEAVSDSATASLAKSLAEPSPPEHTEWKAPPVVPPVELRTERTAAEQNANVVLLNRRVGRWRGMTVLMGAIAALLALFIALDRFAPGVLPFGQHSGQQVAQSQGGTAQQLSARLVAVLQQEPTAPAFLLTVDPQSRTMVVRRVSATAEQGRAYELWLIPSPSSAPRSLGLVGADEFTQRSLPGNVDVAALRNASYAVSLEPSGGSPTGVPTGPVLFTGKIVEAVPTAAPATPKT